MSKQRKLYAVFLGGGEELDSPVFSSLEARGIKFIQFNTFDDFTAYFNGNGDQIAVVVLGPGGLSDDWARLADLLDCKECDFVPFIDLTGSDNLPTTMRLKRLFYSLPQTVDPNDLATAVQFAFLENRRYRDLVREVESRSSAIGTIMAGIFEVKTVREAKNLTTMLSLACPDAPSAAFVLSELIINAIEHGNLGISYEEKSELVASGNWTQEVERRQALPENTDKKVTVQFDRDSKRTLVTIMDMGDGFDWQRYTGDRLSQGKPLYSGRGIAMASTMDECNIQYKGTGSVVTVEMANGLGEVCQ